MWRSAKLPRQQMPVAPPTTNEPSTEKKMDREESSPLLREPLRDVTRNAPEGQKLLDELRGQPGFGVLMTSSEVRPANGQGNLGQRLNHELDLAVSRERQVLELIDLASRPARDLTPEQFKRLYEAMSPA